MLVQGSDVTIGPDEAGWIKDPAFDQHFQFAHFSRIQITGSMQLTPDIQVVFGPGMRSDAKTSVVLGLRLTTDF